MSTAEEEGIYSSMTCMIHIMQALTTHYKNQVPCTTSCLGDYVACDFVRNVRYPLENIEYLLYDLWLQNIHSFKFMLKDKQMTCKLHTKQIYDGKPMAVLSDAKDTYVVCKNTVSDIHSDLWERNETLRPMFINSNVSRQYKDAVHDNTNVILGNNSLFAELCSVWTGKDFRGGCNKCFVQANHVRKLNCIAAEANNTASCRIIISGDATLFVYMYIFSSKEAFVLPLGMIENN